LQELESSASGFGARLRAAAANFLGDRRVLWSLVGIMAVRRVLADIPVFLPFNADAYPFITSGRQALSNPGTIYANSAAQISAGNPFTVLWPPTQTLLAVPFSLLPAPADVWLWAATNALMCAIGLYCLYRAIGAQGGLALPIYVLIVLCFTPLFEDIRLGQRGGPLLFLAGAAMLAVRRHPVLAGALSGLGTSLKFYPAAMVLSVAPRQWTRFTGALIGVATVVLGVAFIPFGSPLFYLTRVLIPTLSGTTTSSNDCFQNSTSLLFSRLVGGQDFSVIDSSGIWSTVTLVPWHVPWLAQALTYLTIAALVAGAVWAPRRSGWAQPYSLSLAFSLGALVPGEVFTYQFIPLLPLTLVLVLKSIERRRWATVAVVGTAVWILISSPCALVFPGLWTIAGLTIFGAAIRQAQLFREPDSKARDEGVELKPG
jgi:Glycosyltransferase family 87